MSVKNLLTTVTILLLGLVSYSAHADRANYPGSVCVKWNASDPEPELSSSKIRNPSSSRWLRLDCPALRTDFDGLFHDAGVDGSWVRMVDRHYSSNARCRLVSFSHNTSGSTSFWGTGNRYTSGSGNQAQHLNTGSLGGENSASHLYFSCHLPPTYSGNRSALVTYQVNQ